MNSNDSKRYYWARISENFFDNHKIRIIQEQKYGSEAVLLYIFLIAESASHFGELRNDDELPYSAEELGALCRIPAESRATAFELLAKYRLIAVKEDGTIVIPEIEKYVGSSSGQSIRKQTAKTAKQPTQTTYSGKNRELTIADFISAGFRVGVTDKYFIETLYNRNKNRLSEISNIEKYIATVYARSMGSAKSSRASASKEVLQAQQASEAKEKLDFQINKVLLSESDD